MAGAIPGLTGKLFPQRQLDARVLKGYKLPNHPVGACQITITTDKSDNKSQERKRLRPLFFFQWSFDNHSGKSLLT